MNTTNSRPSVAEMMKALGSSLYTPEYGDWVLSVHHSLTEPTCPTATIMQEDEPEGDEPLGPTFRCDADTIEAAIAGVVAAAYDTIVLGKAKPPTVPWTEPGEMSATKLFLACVEAQRAPPTPVPGGHKP